MFDTMINNSGIRVSDDSFAMRQGNHRLHRFICMICSSSVLQRHTQRLNSSCRMREHNLALSPTSYHHSENKRDKKADEGAPPRSAPLVDSGQGLPILSW